jgi:hypothetical protein
MYKTEVYTGLFLIVVELGLSCLSTGIFKQQDQALDQQYIQTIKFRNLVIDLGNGVNTNAQLTYPAVGKGLFPGVLLIHGAGPIDMNYGGIFWQIVVPIGICILYFMGKMIQHLQFRKHLFYSTH